MKKTPNSKLSLRTETVAALTPSHLQQVAGGWTTIMIPVQVPTQTQAGWTTIMLTQETTGAGSGG